MNPKRTVAIGVLVMLTAMALMPVSSALTVTTTQFEIVSGLGNIETYTMNIHNGDVYVTGVDYFNEEMKIYTLSSTGGGHIQSKLVATYEFTGNEIYKPTDSVWFNSKMYITSANLSAPEPSDGNVWQTNLYVYDPDEKVISIAEKLDAGILPQATVFGDYLVVAGDLDQVYYTTDGVAFTEKTVNDLPPPSTYQWVVGVETQNDELWVMTRNCTLDPEQVVLNDELNLHYVNNITDNFTKIRTNRAPSRVIMYRSDPGAVNYSIPLYALPNGLDIGFVANQGTYTVDTDTSDFTRVYNGDSDRNPIPVLTSPTDAKNHLYVTTVKDPNNAPVCPAVIPPEEWLSEHHVFDVNTETGDATPVVTFEATTVYDVVDAEGFSLLFATSGGLFTQHAVTVNFDAQIQSLMIALLIIGGVLILFGVMSWNRGFEDVIALSVGGGLLATAIALYFFPQIYLSWALILIPVFATFAIMYYFIQTYNLEVLDFRLKSIDAIWILLIVGVLLAIDLSTGYITNTVIPFWATAGGVAQSQPLPNP